MHMALHQLGLRAGMFQGCLGFRVWMSRFLSCAFGFRDAMSQ